MSNVDLLSELLHLKITVTIKRLVILGLEPLELRRLHCDLIQYYKIFNKLTSLNPVEYFTFHKLSLSSRASLFIKPFKRPNYVLSSFFYRSINCWNSLSLTLKQSRSLNVFENNLNSFESTKFLKGMSYIVLLLLF